MKKNHQTKQALETNTSKDPSQLNPKKQKLNAIPIGPAINVSAPPSPLTNFDPLNFSLNATPIFPVDSLLDQWIQGENKHEQASFVQAPEIREIPVSQPLLHTNGDPNPGISDQHSFFSTHASSNIEQPSEKDPFLSPYDEYSHPFTNTWTPRTQTDDLKLASTHSTCQESSNPTFIYLDPINLIEPLYFIDGTRLTKPGNVCVVDGKYYVLDLMSKRFLYTENALNELHPMHYLTQMQCQPLMMNDASEIRETYDQKSRSIQYDLKKNKRTYRLTTASDFLRDHPRHPMAEKISRFRAVDKICFVGITPGDYFRSNENYVTISGRRVASDALVINLYGTYCVVNQQGTHVIYHQAYLKTLHPFFYKIVTVTHTIQSTDVNECNITEKIEHSSVVRFLNYKSKPVTNSKHYRYVYVNPVAAQHRHSLLPSDMTSLKNIVNPIPLTTTFSTTTSSVSNAASENMNALDTLLDEPLLMPETSNPSTNVNPTKAHATELLHEPAKTHTNFSIFKPSSTTPPDSQASKTEANTTEDNTQMSYEELCEMLGIQP